MLIYDIEIIKAIPDKNGVAIPGIEYCAGWHDHANMGISVIGVYDYAEDRYRVFLEDNASEFFELCDRSDLLVSFNGLSFDNPVICASYGWGRDGIGREEKAAQSIFEGKCYDLLVEIWAAGGLGPQFKYPTHVGFGLDACCQMNFGTRKTGNGALAPVLWQRGARGEVIDYCLNDVKLTKQLLDQVIATGELLDPRSSSLLHKILNIRKPNEALKKGE